MAAYDEVKNIQAELPGPWEAVGLPQTKPPMPYVLGLLGLPGTGKSTLARAVLNLRKDAFYIGGENIAYAMFGKDKCTPEEYQRVYEWIYAAIDHIARSGYGIIFDSTNNLKVYRDQLSKRLGVKAKVFFVELTGRDEIMTQRLLARKEDHGDPVKIAGPFSEATFESFKKNFEPLALAGGEKGIVIDIANYNLEEQTEIINQYIAATIDIPVEGNESQIAEYAKTSSLVNFDWGHIDLGLLDTQVFTDAVNQALASDMSALQYGEARGYAPLVETLIKRLASDGLEAERQNFIITNGATHALDLVIQSIFRDGQGKIACEMPAFDTARHLFYMRNLELVPINVGPEGLDVERLEILLQSGKEIRAVYVCPVMNNPTNVTYTKEVGDKLLSLAAQYDFVIIEDGVYCPLLGSELICPESLFARDGGKHVVYLGSFSKIISPGLRIGFAIGPTEIVSRAVFLNKFTQSSANRFAQAIVNELVKGDWLTGHVQKIAEELKAKRAKLTAALEREAGDLVDIFQPAIRHDGFYLWVRIRNVNTQHLLPFALKEGMSFIPGDIYFFPDMVKGREWARLCVSNVEIGKIDEGVERLKKAIYAYQGQA
jgi:2-aminoadipate transaminase